MRWLRSGVSWAGFAVGATAWAISTQLNYGSRYYCFKSDRANYEKMLNEVLAAGDPLPEARLQNLIAKRRARRYLENKLFQEDCGFIG